DGTGDACDSVDDDFRSGGSSDENCSYQPPRAQFFPMEEAGWSSSAFFPTFVQVMSTPTVVNLTDDNGDGFIDENDVPDIVFNSFEGSGTWPNIHTGRGCLRAISGDTLTDIWAVDPSVTPTDATASIAAGDIDGDGYVELVTTRNSGGIIVFEHTGEIKWSCNDADKQNCVNYALNNPHGIDWGGPAIADIDYMGLPEIVIGATAYSADGVLLWDHSTTGGTGDNGVGPLSAVADLDMADLDMDDWDMEVVTGSTAYNWDGTIAWDNGLSDGFVALGNFDGDVYPEIVVVSGSNIRLQEHDGTLIWEQALPGSGSGGPPTVGDFDNDGEPEIGVADMDTYVTYETNGTILWQTGVNGIPPTHDHSSSRTGSSVFDFEDDGYVEVVYNDEEYLRVYDGATGTVLFQEENTSFTAYEYPIIVDVDNDGNAEIVVCANDFHLTSNGEAPADTGIRVFADYEDNWVRTRPIWNQHTYHVSNINVDGSLPWWEDHSWIETNSYRLNELPPGEGSAIAAPDLASDDPEASAAACPTSIQLMVWVENRGAIATSAGVPVAFYSGDPITGQHIGTVYT
ncbi:MAG: PQQ-like beta-propeller repeat protein, partial [Lentisphaeria bacterium]|nr:PQQ-like beta-propeller repeat protein [Lentisphaeria bacterium]